MRHVLECPVAGVKSETLVSAPRMSAGRPVLAQHDDFDAVQNGKRHKC